jgi:molybdopterin converting factor small subunit
VRFAVNHRLAHRGTPVHDGDEVAVFPPVTGG